jgi:hypothetical protein
MLNKHIFFLPDQKMTVVNVHTKFNFLSFPIFLMGINFIIYKFQNLKFNFSHAWDPESGKNHPGSWIF